MNTSSYRAISGWHFLLLMFSVFGLAAGGFAYFAGAAEIPDKPGKTELVPHKALYDVSLVGTRSGSQIVNISGQMFYDWHPGCDGWISNHRFNLLYEYADSPAMRVTSDFSTFESFDGRSLDFSSQRKRDGQLFEELRGHAKLDGNFEGEAVYTIPEDLVYDMPAGSQFSMTHTYEILNQIRDNKKFYSAVVFDGSDEDGPIEINSFLGKPANALAYITPTANLDMALINTPAWNIRLAMFPLNEPSPTPDYEMDIVFHENGIISDMTIEYDDFTVSQKLTALERLEEGCDAPE